MILVTGTVFAQEELGRALDRAHEHGLDMTHGHDLDMTYRQALDCPMVDKRIIGELTDMQPEISSWEECGELKHKQNDEKLPSQNFLLGPIKKHLVCLTATFTSPPCFHFSHNVRGCACLQVLDPDNQRNLSSLLLLPLVLDDWNC